MVISCFADLCVAHVGRTVDAYRRLFDLEVRVDHGWYAELGTRDSALIAFVEQGHETVPAAAGGAPAGLLVTFHIDDAEPPYLRAIDTGWPVLVDLVSDSGNATL